MKKAKQADLYLPDPEMSETPGPTLRTTRCAYNEILNTCTYGIEYVIDEIFKDNSNKLDQSSAIDWFGISDLTMD
jgi:hypothetical protein